MGSINNIGYDNVGYVFFVITVLTVFFLRPRLLIYALIILTIDDTFIPSPIKFGTINIYSQDIILLLYCCFTLFIIIKRTIKKEKIFDLPQDAGGLIIFCLLFIILHLAYMIIGLNYGIAPQRLVRRFIQYADCLYIFWPLIFINKNEQFKRLLIFIVIIALLNPLRQIYSFINMPEWARATTSSGTLRIGSDGMPLMACALFTFLVWRQEVKYYILSFMPILSMILVAHRSVLLALGTSLMFILIWTKEVTKSLLFVYLASFSLLIALITFGMYTGYNFMDDTITRAGDTFNFENSTTMTRVTAIKDNIFVLKKKPIFGFGYNYEFLRNIFPATTPSGRKLTEESYYTLGELNVLHPHNFILRFLSHTGIIGTFLIVGIISFVLKRSYSCIRKNCENRDISVFIFCSTIFFIIMGLMNTTFFTEGYIFWILCGASLKYCRSNKVENSRKAQNYGF